jgi:hypothetical protein
VLGGPAALPPSHRGIAERINKKNTRIGRVVALEGGAFFEVCFFLEIKILGSGKLTDLKRSR